MAHFHTNPYEVRGVIRFTSIRVVIRSTYRRTYVLDGFTHVEDVRTYMFL
jgi:hypothetical protein